MDDRRYFAAMTDPNPYGIQVTVGPGGLSSTAHLLNVIIALLTCGLWLPIYLVIALAAPTKSVQVLAPAGTPQAAIDAAYAKAAAPTPEERRRRSHQWLAVGIVTAGVVLVCVGSYVFSHFAG